jgi:negative regulator of replication initiation
MPESKTRVIRIFEEDYKKIASEGRFGESQAEVVHRMLNRIEELKSQISALKQVAFDGPKDYEKIVIPELKAKIAEFDKKYPKFELLTKI